MDNEDWSEFTSKYPNYNDPSKDELSEIRQGTTERYLIYLLKIIGMDVYKSSYDTLLIIYSYTDAEILFTRYEGFIIFETKYIDLTRFNISSESMELIAREWLQQDYFHSGFGYDDCTLFTIHSCGNTKTDATIEEIIAMNGKLLHK